MDDPRIDAPGICGVTAVGGTGIEWICIAQVHSPVYQRRSSDRTHHRGDLIIGGSSNPQRGYAAAGDRHYMVPRYPQRNQEDA